MFENPRRGRQARNFATNVPKISNRLPTDIFQKLTLGAPGEYWIDLRRTKNPFKAHCDMTTDGGKV